VRLFVVATSPGRQPDAECEGGRGRDLRDRVPMEVPPAAGLTQTQLGSYPLQVMYARRRIVLELSPHELRYVLRLARKLRKAGHRMPPFDVSHVLSVCLTAGMAAVAKELEQAAETPVNAGGDDSAGALPGV
jgi:hypothetical protein